MVQKVFITHPIPEDGVTLLKERGYEVLVHTDGGEPSKKILIEALKKDAFDAVVCLITDHIDAEVLDAAGKQCKIFANYSPTIENIVFAEARKRNIIITNTPDIISDAVAEHTVALMLALLHRIPEADRFTRAKKFTGWKAELFVGTDMRQKIVGIVGLGRTGLAVARHLVRGFDVKIIYCDIKRNEQFEKEHGAQYRDSIEKLLPDVDIVSLHLPPSVSMKGFINEDRLSLMRNSAYLINTSSGSLINEFALAKALKDGHIRGAALDVYEKEPEIEKQLFEIDSVILTPHIGSATDTTRVQMSIIVAKNVIEALEGRVPPNIVVQAKEGD